MRVLAISDVTLGYGTPQLPLLVSSLADYFEADASVLEPIQPEVPARHSLFPSLRIERVSTASHPHSEPGRREYVWRAARRINELKPDVLVICCTYSLPVLFRLSYKPRKVIYYAVESIPFYGAFDVEMNAQAGSRIDIVIFPEENRAAAEVRRCGFREPVGLVLYNATNRAGGPEPLPVAERNGRLLYAGTISPTQTFADYYVHKDVRQFPIDLFGSLKFPREQSRQTFLAEVSGGVRYRGFVDSAELAGLRRQYVFSMVAWNPDNENQLYAAPNKFFDSIADGVPPIAAPHPQCKLLLERYRCGILMPDWSFESFRDALRRAMRMYKTPEWLELVGGCRRAVAAELNWDTQFEKVRKYL